MATRLDDIGTTQVTDEDEAVRRYQDLLTRVVLEHPTYSKATPPRGEMYTFLITACGKDETFVPVHLRERIVSGLLNAWYTYDRIQMLMDDELVTDIHVMGPVTVYRKNGKLFRSTEARFDADEDVVAFVERQLEPTPHRYSLAAPITDAMLPGKIRANVIGGPSIYYTDRDERGDLVTKTATVVSLRKQVLGFTLEQLRRLDMFTRDMMSFLITGMRLGDTTILAGGPGSAKTTVLNALTAHMDGYMNACIEEQVELDPMSGMWIRLTERKANGQGAGQITLEDCMYNTLRMDVDNVVIGEIRWPEQVWLALRLMMLTKRAVLTSFHTRLGVGRGVHHVLQRLMLEGATGSKGVAPLAAVASLLADNVRIIATTADVQGTKRMTEIGYLEGFDADAGAIRWVRVAHWEYATGTHVFDGVPESFVQRAAVEGVRVELPVQSEVQQFLVPKSY